MRKFTTLLLGITAIAASTTSCRDVKESKDSKPAEIEQTATVSDESKMDKTEKIEALTVHNANLATEDDLKGIGLSDEMVAQVLDKRPFLTMNEFDVLLSSDIDKTNLYKRIFVPFNLNTTAEADFKMIPGVGDRMAHEFEEYRPYTSIRQFRKEIGKYVDEDEVARYENYVFVPIELNTASEDDIKALPGVGNRMAHEFEEYRPYRSMEQFRKEIGKYVDDKELVRLERFVYIKK